MPKGATEVGSAYVSIYPDTSHFEDDLNTELSQVNMQGVGKKAGESFQSGFSPVTVALGNLLSSAVEGAVNMFSQNLQRGIERLDTIQNFPRLMQTFGYATDDADASVRAIQEHLDGLPGTTDEVLRLVQALSDSTGSLELATTTGLAFNDMLTASGADAYTSMYAMRMFDQMMGGAAFSAQRWQGIVSKMPLQMNLVAESLLGAGANSAQLGDALKNGEVSMQDLAKAMSELGPEFETQARAMSYGIGTAMRNVQNRTGMGVAAILEGIGQRQIANVINNFSYGVRDAMYAIGEGVEWLRRKVLTSGLGVLFGELMDRIKTAISDIDWQPVKDFLSGVITGLHDALQWVLDNSDIVLGILAGLGTAIAAMGILGIIDNIKNALFGAQGIITLIMANPFAAIVIAIGAVVGGLVYFFTQTEKGREMWATFTEFLGNAFEFAGGVISTVVSSIRTFLTALMTVVIDAATAVWDFFAGIAEGIIAFAQGAWDVIVQAWNAGSELLGIIAAFIGDTISAIFNVVGAILETATNAWDTFWTFVDWVCQGVVDVILALVKAAIAGAKSFVKDCMNTVKKIKNLFDTFKRNLSRTWENIKTTAKNVWDGILHAITHPMETAQKTVEGIIGGIQGIINSLTGKTVDVGVNDNRSQVDSIVSDIQRSINSIHDKRVNIEYYGFQSGIKGVDVTTYTTAAGNKRIVAEHIPLRMAAGGIVTKATAAIFGEEGDEAVIPLSNRNRVKPFAKAVAAEIGDKGTVNNYYIDGNLVSTDAVLARALDTVAERVNGRRRMGAIA